MSSLAAVQADGFYIDPSQYDPRRGKGSANAIAQSHPLGVRAKRLRTEGILVVRFELPYDAVCTLCGHYVSHGVRFNADKRATGSYLSTPIYSFSMPCPAACGQTFLISTDPQHTDYLYQAGLRRKVKDFVPDEGTDGLGRAGGSLLACAAVAEGRAAASGDGMLRLQLAVEDRVRAGRAAAEQAALQQASARRRDPALAAAAWAALGRGRQAAALAEAGGRARGLAVPLAALTAGAVQEDRDTVTAALGAREEARAEAMRGEGAAAAAAAAAQRATLLAARRPSPAASHALVPARRAESAALLAAAAAPRPRPLSSTAGLPPALVGIIEAGRKRRAEEEAGEGEAAGGEARRIAAALRAASARRAPQVTLGMGPRQQGQAGGLARAALAQGK